MCDRHIIYHVKMYNPLVLLRKQVLLIGIILLHALALNAQRTTVVEITNSTLASTASKLPFWFTTNRLGKIQSDNQYINVSEINLRKPVEKDNSALAFYWGTSLVGAIARESYLQINQAYAGISFRGWQLTAGLFADEEKYDQLSLSNGSIDRSLNARPYPKIRISTRDFIPIFSSKVFFIKAEWDEGWLVEKRFVDHVKIHHKSLAVSVRPNKSWDFRIGINNYVMWGGESPDERIGQMPESFRDYLIYISGSQGDEGYPKGDQMNVAGNMLGSYLIEIRRINKNNSVTLYISHPFEDLSGVNLKNWPDNLIGINLAFENKKQLINNLVVEFVNTTQQSVVGDYQYWDEEYQKMFYREEDNYFSHYIYRSGFTYHQHTMALPLFEPVFSEDRSMRFPSNRFFAFHSGIEGELVDNMEWKCLITLSKHFGTYRQPYEETVKKLNSFLSVAYKNPQFPVELGISTAFDYDSSGSAIFGAGLHVSKRF